MYLNIKEQKNGHIILTAPDGTIYPYEKPSEANIAEVCQRIGKDVLAILSDPDQPEVEQLPPGAGSQPAGNPLGKGGPGEMHLRGLINSFIPGAGDKIMDGAQALSYQGDDNDGEATG